MTYQCVAAAINHLDLMIEWAFDGRVSSSVLIGQRVNNYEIRSLLGEGGMGAVYLAEHPIIGRKVAIKVLRRELAEDTTLVARFINEARAANAIKHPNIVEILDVGTLPDDIPYLVMELLEGESLASRIHRVRRVRMGDAVEFAFQAAGALTAAHDAGIIHRDLKPDNLFLTPDAAMPGRERVKVLDFGIAKLRAELSGGAVRTSTGAVMGTPPYMSPEQCLGKASEIDQGTDIYALGVILFEMLCGRPPFVGEGFGEVLLMHMSQQPPNPRGINPGIPPHIERSILKALEKNKADRFPSMAAFQKALSEGPARTMSGPDVAVVDPLGQTDPLEAGQGQRPPVQGTVSLNPISSSGAVQPLTTFSRMTGSMVERDATGRRRRRSLGVLAVAVGVGAVLAVIVAGRWGRGPEPARPNAAVVLPKVDPVVPTAPVVAPVPLKVPAPVVVAPVVAVEPAVVAPKRPAGKKTVRPSVAAARKPDEVVPAIEVPKPVAPAVVTKPAPDPAPAPKAPKRNLMDSIDKLVGRPNP